jgi:CcmD family protein
MKQTNLIALIGALFLATPAFAEGGMEEYFFESGKIKVVVTVVSVVLAGIFVYLFLLDRRISKIERHRKS